MDLSRHSIVSIFRQPHGAFESAQNTNTTAVVPQYGTPVRFNPMIGFALAALFTAFFFMGSLCVYVKRSCSIARRRRAHAVTLPPVSGLQALAAPLQLGLDRETIQSLPVFPFTSEKCSNAKHGKVATECSVCLTDFQEDEVVKLLPGCSHFFHIGCIDMWLVSHSTCPLCRCILVPVRCCSDHPESPSSISQTPDEVAIAIPDEQTAAAHDRPSPIQEEPESELLLSDSSEQREKDVFKSSSTPKVSARNRFFNTLHRSNSSPPIQSSFPEQERGGDGRRENDVNESLGRPHGLRRAISSVSYQSRI